MDFQRYFWDAACRIDPGSKLLNEGIHLPICNQDKLVALFQHADLVDVTSIALDIETLFDNFDDYWNLFLDGQGPDPGYLASLTKELRDELEVETQKELAKEKDGSIRLNARACAI